MPFTIEMRYFLKASLISAAALLLGLATLASAPPAMAQSSSLQPFPLTNSGRTSPTAPTTASATGKTINIGVTYRFYIEGETDTMEEQTALANKGRKQLYSMFANECTVLKETIAETCSIDRASVNAQMNNNRRGRSYEATGLQVSGSARYSIVLKPDAAEEKK